MQYLLGHRLVFALCVALVLVAYGLLIRAGLHVYVISGNYTVTVPTLLASLQCTASHCFCSFAHVNASQLVPAGCSLAGSAPISSAFPWLRSGLRRVLVGAIVLALPALLLRSHLCSLATCI